MTQSGGGGEVSIGADNCTEEQNWMASRVALPRCWHSPSKNTIKHFEEMFQLAAFDLGNKFRVRNFFHKEEEVNLLVFKDFITFDFRFQAMVVPFYSRYFSSSFLC